MPANLLFHQPFTQVKTISGNNPEMTGQYPEAAAQTFAIGVPVQLNTAGYLQQWDSTTVPFGFAGISKSYGTNLGAPGKGAPIPPFGIVGLGAGITFGSVPNQPQAVNIVLGAPMVDGRQVIYIINQDTIFEGQIDNSTGGAYATTLAMVKLQAGISFDSSIPPQAYVDIGKTGANAAVVIKALSPLDPIGTNGGRVWFQFLPAAQQL